MTREVAIDRLRKISEKTPIRTNGDDLVAITMAIKALSPICDRDCEHCTWTECPIEPCEDTVSIRKDVLKCRVGNIVAYNVEWLKKHWQMEMDIVCGVKPCDDVISREDVLAEITRFSTEEGASVECQQLYCDVNNMPSVIQKPIECDDAISRQAVLDETIRKNSIWNSITNSEGKNLEEIIFELPSVTQKSETEIWNGIHGQITAPKGTFKKIWEDAESEDKE